MRNKRKENHKGRNANKKVEELGKNPPKELELFRISSWEKELSPCSTCRQRRRRGCCRSRSWRCSSSRDPPWGRWCPRWRPPSRPWTSSARSTSPTWGRAHSPTCPWEAKTCTSDLRIECFCRSNCLNRYNRTPVRKRSWYIMMKSIPIVCLPQENHPCVVFVVHRVVRIGRVDASSAEHPGNEDGWWWWWWWWCC